MLTATNSFIEALEKWLCAMRTGDFEAAKFHADYMAVHGELLIIHPEFRRSFWKRWPGLEPKDALEQLTHFLICATEVRANEINGGEAAKSGLPPRSVL